MTLKWVIRRFLARRGYDIRQAPLLIDFLRSRNVDMVIDVGANIGQFGSELRAWGYRGRIVSFEPIRDAFEQLSATARSDPLWTVRNEALGAVDRVAPFNISEGSEFSSFVPQTALATRLYKQARVIRTIDIKILRLDDVYKDISGNSTFLKIDTQGYEEEVLKGAGGSLADIVGVQLELPIEHLYCGTWNLTDALNFMKKTGFVVSQLRPTNVINSDPASALELDVIFRRITETAND